MKIENKITAGYFAAFIVLGLVMAALGPTLPGLADQTNVSLKQISVLFTARSLGFMLGALLAGRLYDRFPGHQLMALAILCMAITMALIPFLPILGLLTAVMFLLGLFEPGIDVGGNTLILWLHRHKAGPYMNGMHFFFGVGAFFSPIIIAWVIATSETLQAAFWILAVLILLPALYIIWLPSPTAIPEEETVGPKQSNRTLVLLIAFFFFLYGGAEVSYGGWIFTFAVEQGLATEEAAALLTSLFWGALTVGRLLSIPLAVRFRNRTIILSDLIGCLLSVAIILIWPQSVAAVWIGTIFLGVSMASVFPTTLSLAERHLPVSGQTTSYFFVGASLGAMSVPWLIGQWFETVGPLATMAVIFSGLLAATAVFGVLMCQLTLTTRLQPEVSHD